MHDAQHHVFFGERFGNVNVRWVCAAVDDAVHVEVEVVEFGEEGCVGDDLIDFWIAFA